MYRLKFILLFSMAIILLRLSAVSQISQVQAVDIVMNDVVAHDTLNLNVYLFPDLSFENYFNLSPYDSLLNPYDTAWIFFIDLMPEYGWGHPCEYVFVQQSTGNYSIQNKSIPPLNYWLTWEEISVPYFHQSVVQFTDTSFQMSIAFTADPHKFALLITCNAWDDQARWNNLSLVYTALTEKYGFKDENIFVLSGNGVFDPETMNLDLNGDDYDNDFDGPCTKEKITEVFEYLETTMTEEDIFLFYATTHGDTTGVGQDTTSLRLDNFQPLYDYELEEMVNDLTCSEMVFSMDICNGGGMIDNLEGPHRVIQVPVPWGSLVWRGWTYFDFFTYGWGTAVRGFHPGSNTEPWTKGDTIGKHPDLSLVYPYWNMPDTMPDLLSFNGNGDGFIQFGETFNYIKYLDAEADSLGIEYQNHGFIEDLLTLDGIEGRVDTSQGISGNFLIGRKLTLAPGVVLSDNSTYLNHCNLFLNDSTEILVEDSATLNINGAFTEINGCVGQSFINIEGDVSANYMNFIGDTNALIHVNFNNPSKLYALEYFDFDHADIFADCDSLSFSFTSFDNTPIEFTGSYLVFNNTNTVADSPLDFSGNYLTITYNDFNNSDMELKSGSISMQQANDFSDSDIEFSGDELYITGPNNFNNSVLDLSNGNIIISENEFENSSVSISHPLDEAAFIQIANNSFENDTTVTSNAVVTIEDFKNFQVDTNLFMYESGRGIELFYAGWDGRGVQQIAKNTIELEQPSTSLWSDVGIHSYSSHVNINNNQIRQNSYGLVGFHNSDLFVLGNSSADDISETQLIGDNTRVQCLFNEASFPTEFHWNVIRDTTQYSFQYHPFIKTVEYDELMQDTSEVPDWRGDPELNVINNCWVNDTNPSDRLIPIGNYIWRDPWCPSTGGGHFKTIDIPQSIYYQAKNDILDSNYLTAESEFKQILSEYPGNKYALASLKGLFALNPAIYDTNYSVLKQYCDSLALNPGDSLLGKTAEWFSIRCNIENQNYQQAINALDSILANPGTYADSVFALIDLSEVFSDMSDSTGMKLALVTKNPQVIPGSYKQFLTQRKEWIDLLLKSDEKPIQGNEPNEKKNDLNMPCRFVTIYPNPSATNFNVSYEVVQKGEICIKVLTFNGQTLDIISEGILEPDNYSLLISSADLPNGCYLVIISFNQAVIDSRKLMVYH